jgi:hypothetical protein
MPRPFTVRQWQAWAPGIEGEQAWARWLAAPFAPRGEGSPALAEMPPMQRRRVDHLGRMALQVAWWCQPGDAHAAIPLLFASRHGELARTYEMLCTLARDEPLSPTQFGLSTHNAIGAQYAIARGLPVNYGAVSAGAATTEAAIVEALGLLADGADEVLVVDYDAPLPDAYAPFRDEPDADYAWAVRLALPREGEPSMTLAPAPFAATRDTGTGPDAAASLPHGLDVLRMLAGGVDRLDFVDGPRTWQWRRSPARAGTAT